MALLLNGTPNGIFYAFVTRQSGAAFMFASNPNVREGVRILSKSKGMGYVGVGTGAVRVPGATEKLIPTGEGRQGDVEIRHYAIETTLPNTITADVDFQAKAEMTLEADEPVTGWVPFSLFSKLRVDSASWSDGSVADVYKPKNSPAVWVKLPKTTRARRQPPPSNGVPWRRDRPVCRLLLHSHVDGLVSPADGGTLEGHVRPDLPFAEGVYAGERGDTQGLVGVGQHGENAVGVDRRRCGMRRSTSGSSRRPR